MSIELVNASSKARIIFITGTDTGVGKTLLTGLLLHHLRDTGCHALAVKPFCSGSRADVRFLRTLQDRELELDEINPFHFREPVAPLVASRRHRRSVSLAAAVQHVGRISRRCECLLVEGAGGLLVPLGEGFAVSDLILGFTREVIIAAANRLGTINHTRLTAAWLHHILDAGKGPSSYPEIRLKIALMNHQDSDSSSATNQTILAELVAPTPVINIPFLGPNALRCLAISGHQKKIKKVLARLLD